MDPKNLNKNNLACGGVNFGSLSLISFSVAAAQVGSSSSSFLFSRAQELSGVGPAGAFLAGAFGGDWGSRPEKEISDEQRVHFPYPPHCFFFSRAKADHNAITCKGAVFSIHIRYQSHS